MSVVSFDTHPHKPWNRTPNDLRIADWIGLAVEQNSVEKNSDHAGYEVRFPGRTSSLLFPLSDPLAILVDILKTLCLYHSILGSSSLAINVEKVQSNNSQS